MNTLDCETNSPFSLRKIQRFITNYSLDSNLIAQLILGLLPNKNEKLILFTDRMDN